MTHYIDFTTLSWVATNTPQKKCSNSTWRCVGGCSLWHHKVWRCSIITCSSWPPKFISIELQNFWECKNHWVTLATSLLSSLAAVPEGKGNEMTWPRTHWVDAGLSQNASPLLSQFLLTDPPFPLFGNWWTIKHWWPFQSQRGYFFGSNKRLLSWSLWSSLNF